MVDSDHSLSTSRWSIAPVWKESGMCVRHRVAVELGCAVTGAEASGDPNSGRIFAKAGAYEEPVDDRMLCGRVWPIRSRLPPTCRGPWSFILQSPCNSASIHICRSSSYHFRKIWWFLVSHIISLSLHLQIALLWVGGGIARITMNCWSFWRYAHPKRMEFDHWYVHL